MCIILALKIARECGLSIKLLLMGIQIQYGGGTDDSLKMNGSL